MGDGDMVFWLQPTENSYYSCVGIVNNTIELLSTCDSSAVASQQFFMSAIVPDAPVNTSGTSAPASW